MTDNNAAAGLLALAQQRLVKRYPFHARFLSCWRLQPVGTLPTVGVTVRQAVVWLLYNPAFVVGCSLDELSGVLHHEVNHLLFGHPWEDPRHYPDRRARLVAEEVTVNEWVPEPLPGRPILLRDFPRLPPDEDTTTRYHRLAAAGPHPVMDGGTPAPSAVPKTSHAEPKKKAGEPKNDAVLQPRDNHDLKAEVRAASRMVARAATREAAGPHPVTVGGTPVPAVAQETPHAEPKKEASEPINEDALQPLDDHDLWAEIRAGGAVAELAARAAIREAYEALDPGQRASLPTTLRHKIGQWARGVRPGRDVETLDVTGPGAIDWRRALRHFVRQAAAQPTFARPPRRFPQLLGVVPGSVHRSRRIGVMAVLDTSGSIATATLREVGAELGRMHRDHDVTIVECDAAVHAIYPFVPPLRNVRGRGGTDLRPPFAAEVLSRIRPDVVVFFTNGAGPAPACPPPVPVLWCLTAGGHRPAPWGRAIHMSRPDAAP